MEFAFLVPPELSQPKAQQLALHARPLIAAAATQQGLFVIPAQSTLDIPLEYAQPA